MSEANTGIPAANASTLLCQAMDIHATASFGICRLAQMTVSWTPVRSETASSLGGGAAPPGWLGCSVRGVTACHPLLTWTAGVSGNYGRSDPAAAGRPLSAQVTKPVNRATIDIPATVCPEALLVPYGLSETVGTGHCGQGPPGLRRSILLCVGAGSWRYLAAAGAPRRYGTHPCSRGGGGTRCSELSR